MPEEFGEYNQITERQALRMTDRCSKLNFRREKPYAQLASSVKPAQQYETKESGGAADWKASRFSYLSL